MAAAAPPDPNSIAAMAFTIASSKYLFTCTSSLSPLRLRVLIMNSRASASRGAGSRGRRTMDLSSGSPGTTSQWSNTDRLKQHQDREKFQSTKCEHNRFHKMEGKHCRSCV